MEFGISTLSFSGESVGEPMLERLVGGTGFSRIELFANRPHLDYRDRQKQKEIASWFRATGAAPPSLHLPFFERVGPGGIEWISAVDPEERERQRAIDEIKRALELADRMPLAYVVLHLGPAGQPFNPVVFEHAYAVIHTVSSFSGVDILIENVPNEISTPERIREFLDVARLADVGICYDSGHGRLQGARPHLDRVAAIHLDDNDGESDAHLWPFEGGSAGRT